MLDDRQITPSSQCDDLLIWSRESNAFGWRSYLGDLYGTSDVPAYAAAARADDLHGLPPTLVIAGGADGFRDENIEYALRLGQSGVPTDLTVIAGAPHGVRVLAGSGAARAGTRPCTRGSSPDSNQPTNAGWANATSAARSSGSTKPALMVASTSAL